MTWLGRSQKGRVSVLTPPAFAPLSTKEVKAHLRIDHCDEDGLLENQIAAAVGEIDAPHGWLGRSLATRTLRLTLDWLPLSAVFLPAPPVTEVKRVAVWAPDDRLTVIHSDDSGASASFDFDLSAEPALVWSRAGWPSTTKRGVDKLWIDYVAGYAAPGDIPKPIRQWLLMRVGELYRDRECSVLGVATNRLPHADRMLDGWRVYA